ncbi:MAG: hypothetical protein WCK00_16475, partial [Deltaproteobacteria bacterium]
KLHEPLQSEVKRTLYPPRRPPPLRKMPSKPFITTLLSSGIRIEAEALPPCRPLMSSTSV